MKEWIAGRNPVFECLRAGRRHFFRLLVAKGIDNKGHIPEILALSKQRGIIPEQVERIALQPFSDNHQGIALQASAYPYSDIHSIVENAKSKQEDLLVLILDHLQDPQNLGTLIRSAELFGVHGLVIPEHRAASISPAVVHASSGASEHLLVAQYNLSQAIDYFKTHDVWVIGLDMDSQADDLTQTHCLTGKLALVVGNEGEGLQRLVREKCDKLVRIPIHGRLDSLNASVAGSIALYQIIANKNSHQ
jgi:23S rRNA (guanosine2251-2'-O)-methyltransferase